MIDSHNTSNMMKETKARIADDDRLGSESPTSTLKRSSCPRTVELHSRPDYHQNKETTRKVVERTSLAKWSH